MYVAILQKWEGDDTFTMMMEAPMEKEEECKRTVERLRKDAYKNKTPVEYKMVQLEGEAPLAKNVRGEQEERKIIIPAGTFRGMEIQLERDVKEE